MYSVNNKSKNPSALQWAWQRCAAVMLCMVLVFFGCKEDKEAQKMDEEALLKELASAPVAIVPKEDLPEWLQAKIEYLWELYVVRPSHKSWLVIYRGEWNKRTVYHLWHSSSSNCAEIYYDDGTKPLFGTMIPNLNWVLVYQIVDGVVTEPGTKSANRKSIGDKYEFPDISGINDWWGDPDIIKKRLDALQIPDAILSSISTAGLLETFLEFPYLIDIHFGKNYQNAFDGLLIKFNGLRELLKRPDFTDALIEKYISLSEEVKGVRMLSFVEQGKFSLHHFALEIMLAQDAVIENLSEEQEEALFFLSLERAKMKRNYPDIFANYHNVPAALLYTKKIMKDNIAPANMKEPMMEFIQAPLYVEQNVGNYLNEYINSKSR